MNRYKAITEETRKKVFEFYKKGMTDKQIAEVFEIRPETVRRIINSIKRERGIKN